jgi:hypothetical protein
VLFAIAFASLIYAAVALTKNSASAVTADVARKCSALTAKTYPPRVTGNPAAGSAKGTSQRSRPFFNGVSRTGAMLAMTRASKGGAPRRKPPDLPDKTTAYSRDS